MEQFVLPGHHLTANDVYERVRKTLPNVSLGTVYRNLELLAEAGMIRKLDLGSGQRSYDGGLHRHYHVRCARCGRVSDVTAEGIGDLDAAAAATSDFQILGHELEFEGLCADCRPGPNVEGSGRHGRQQEPPTVVPGPTPIGAEPGERSQS